MKKILSIVLLLLTCISLVACGDKKLTNAPTEEYVISCLKKVPGIIEIAAVTEENDPNGLLNKAGGYTSQVFFSYSLVNQNDLYGTTLIQKGTSAGGSIEVYKNVKDATKRNEYLSSFDGNFLSSGSHCVVGTVIVRTSNELTASQQKLLENNIILALNGDIKSINNNIGKANFAEQTNEISISYGKYFMEKHANSYIYICNENTVFFYDAFDDFNLQGHDEFTYTYLPAYYEDYENAYPMLELDMSALSSNGFLYYKYIHILDESTIMFDGEKFGN